MSTLTLDRWSALSRQEQEEQAARLAGRLPGGFTFQGVTRFSLGGQENRLAEFELEGRPFVLLPGGEVKIGFDRERAWQPNPEEAESWRYTAEDYDLTSSLVEHIHAVTLAPRQVTLAPLLVEVSPGTYKSHVGTGNHAVLVAALAEAGFRLLTPDEWEYACGGGADSLFRWGDHAPCDHYPSDPHPDWDRHQQRNAFGLHIAEDPYKNELTSDGSLTRGGDGGCAICGGIGFFAGWLTLATAYFEKHACEANAAAPLEWFYTVARRVLSVEKYL